MASNEWDEFASGWDSNDDVRIYAEKAFESWNRKVAPLISSLANSRALDFGCGTGLLSEKLAPLCGQVIAVDTSAGMIEVLRKKLAKSGIDNVTALQLDVSGTTIDEILELGGKFDFIVASSVCSFLPDYEGTLGDLTSILNPEGNFVQWDWLDNMPVARIRAAFEASGLIERGIEEAFEMNSEKESMPVVMGLGQFRSPESIGNHSVQSDKR